MKINYGYIIIKAQEVTALKILFRQKEDENFGSLGRYGIENCYFKRISTDRDGFAITKKAHLHRGFELHIIAQGFQEYDIEGRKYRVEKGEFLLIYPSVLHTALGSDKNTVKFAATFNRSAEEQLCFKGGLSDRMWESIDCILSDSENPSDASPLLIENRIFELILSVFRLSGEKEKAVAQASEENATLLLARQYIDDNIERAPSVAEVAKYCYLSPKQLTRIFKTAYGMTPGEYIINGRVGKIEKLLSDPTLSLRDISEIMGFNNEYYFSTFFKKHGGSPPGEYRKMIGM